MSQLKRVLNSYSQPVKELDNFYSSQLKRENFSFFNDSLVSSPPSYKYYSATDHETGNTPTTGGLEKSWKSVYSTSTLADSKQLNENSSSSFALLDNYSNQAINKENELFEQEEEDDVYETSDNVKGFVYQKKLSQKQKEQYMKHSYNQDNQVDGADNWEEADEEVDEEVEEEAEEEAEEDEEEEAEEEEDAPEDDEVTGASAVRLATDDEDEEEDAPPRLPEHGEYQEETYDDTVEGEAYENPHVPYKQVTQHASYWNPNVQQNDTQNTYKYAVTDKLLDTPEYSTKLNRAARSMSLNYPFMNNNISAWNDDNNENSRDVISRFNSESFQREHGNVATQEKTKSPVDIHQMMLHISNSPSKISFPIDNTNLDPYTLEQIDSRIDIRYVPEKGRCAFAQMDYKPGDIIFIELPTLVATPDLDPELWQKLSQLNEQKAFELPPVWHLAALYSLTSLPDRDKVVIFEKWVPDICKKPTEDVLRVIEHTKIDVSPNLYERALQVWRYNSFGHHVSSEGLVLYNRISMLSHDCSASACWHYGVNDAFTLRARKFIPQGSEISISYIGDEDLLKAAHIRQEKLSGWLFKCACERCDSACDTPRGFRCPTCGAGAVFFKTEKYPVDSVTAEATESTCCTLCKAKPSNDDLKLYLHLEEAYIARLSETSKNELVDAEHVYSEAQRVFVQHWVLYQLDTILFEAYRELSRWQDAAFHQSNRIRYVTQVVPEVSYTLAWLYEELGDLLARHYELAVSSYEDSIQPRLNGFQKNSIVNNYETAMNLLLILCGQEHEYTIAAHEKLETVFEAGKHCFEEDEEE